MIISILMWCEIDLLSFKIVSALRFPAVILTVSGRKWFYTKLSCNSRFTLEKKTSFQIDHIRLQVQVAITHRNILRPPMHLVTHLHSHVIEIAVKQTVCVCTMHILLLKITDFAKIGKIPSTIFVIVFTFDGAQVSVPRLHRIRENGTYHSSGHFKRLRCCWYHVSDRSYLIESHGWIFWITMVLAGMAKRNFNQLILAWLWNEMSPP